MKIVQAYCTQIVPSVEMRGVHIKYIQSPRIFTCSLFCRFVDFFVDTCVDFFVDFVTFSSYGVEFFVNFFLIVNFFPYY